MSVNISALGDLKPVDNLDLENYSDAGGKGFQLPPKGRYTVRVRESFEDAFGATKAGHLKATLNPKIVGGEFNDFEIRYVNISAKPYERPKGSGMYVSQFGDFLRSCGIKGRLPGDPQGLADVVASTAGQTFTVDLDWKAYNGVTGMEVKGMENFPVDDKGNPQSWIEDPNDVGEDGSPKRLRANLEVRRYISA